MNRPEDFHWAPVPAKPRERACPDCGARMDRRTSRKESLLLRSISYQCSNFWCGATFRGHEEILYRLVVPVETNPLVKLPVSPTQAHETPLPADGSKPTKDCCPECGEPVRKTCVATDDPYRFIVYVECSRRACTWSARGAVDLEPFPKNQPV